MKHFILKLIEFLQEENGGMSSRRLIFITGSSISIPISLIFGFIHPEYFKNIFEMNLWFLSACAGLTTITRVSDNLTKKK